MPHSWKAYEKAKEIADCLVEARYIEPIKKSRVQGIIQIKLEDPQTKTRKTRLKEIRESLERYEQYIESNQERGKEELRYARKNMSLLYLEEASESD